ncbi:MAG: Hsp20/alpha crystallin family protein [Candidatus Micrarchaeia archaeon]
MKKTDESKPTKLMPSSEIDPLQLWEAMTNSFFAPFKYFDFPIERRFESEIELPKIDIIDNDDSFEINAEMPGIDKKDIKVKATSDAITIRASKNSEKNESGKNYYTRERSSYNYFREVSLPEPIEVNTVKAKYENGLLKINVKKSTSGSAKEVNVD